MRIPNNNSLLFVALALVDAMRHTGTEAITSSLSSQINGSIVENIPNLIQEAEKWESQRPLTIILSKNDSCFNQLMTLETKRSARDKFTRIARNTAPLKHFRNPRRPRRA